MPDSAARNNRLPPVDIHLPMPEESNSNRSSRNRSKRASTEYARYENPIEVVPSTLDVEQTKAGIDKGYKNPWDGDGMPGPLEFTKKFMGGLRNDISRRLVKHAKDDYTDAFTKENFAVIAPSILFLFFACYAPALAFGALFDIATEGNIGIFETVLSTAICGVVYAVFSGQPLTIVGATGPELAYTIVFYNLCKQLDLEYLPTRWWQGMWTALFTVICAITDSCALMKYVTRFSEEIFSATVSVLEIAAALTAIINIFLSDLSTGAQLLSAILCAATYMTAIKFRDLRGSDWMNATWRKHISNYGVVITIILGTIITNAVLVPFGITDLGFLNVPDSIRPTLSLSNGEPRPWVVNPMGTERELPSWAPVFAVPFALGLTILGYLDQNLTEVIVNKKDRLFKKSPGYHLDLFVCAVGMYPLLSILGLPYTHAATVRSLAHVLSLTTYETVPGPDGKTMVTKVTGCVEQRVSHLVVHLLMFVSLAATPLLRLVPQFIIIGIFLYLGMSSIRGNAMFDRMWLFGIWDKERWPDEPFVTEVSTATTHKFTALQLACFAVIIILRYVGAGGAMPFLIAALVPVRIWVVPRFFSNEDLEVLEG